MGSAIMRSLLKASVVKSEDLYVFEPNAERSKAVQEELAINLASSVSDLAECVTMLFVCVKPQVLMTALKPLKEGKGLNDCLLVSIAAGVSIHSLEQAVRTSEGQSNKIIRVMPNTPALIGKGASALCANEHVSVEEKAKVLELIQHTGLCVEVSENAMDAVTALSGSGPAYVYLFAEALIDAGVRQGLSRQQSKDLSLQTLEGAAALLRESDLHPAQLKDQVTSPGGTTIEALNTLEALGFRNAVHSAVEKACERSKQLSGQ